ncbi:META domain-containing protein [Pokkaliibacter sp. MBI-7]|uniref:META domain-containing protein n=1 Tax=Pokkaliibacter sp. MBI-7 TaxID=3040600 RepID=UPI00244C952B|nr:META domain-containing protein [Pokkaliibacter sp. MBI-7]MDH2432491.1 META domain-containing protein [Pokkaliibacter sp. MBI-7]
MSRLLHTFLLGSSLLLAACIPRPQSSTPDQPLENTYWKLTQLGTDPVQPDTRMREPYLQLSPEQQRVTGFSGCNLLAGQYQLTARQLHLGPLISTRMACMQGMALESHYIQALEQVRGWQISGHTLTLLDAQQQPLLQFEESNK